MSRLPPIELRLYPDDCDAYGHVNQAAFLRLFERARWELLATGPGTDVFVRAGAWPAIRRASVEYYAPGFAGEVLSFQTALSHLGRTSMTMYQIARRASDNALVAAGDFLAICVDQQGRPVAVPDAVREFFGARPSVPVERTRQVPARGASLTVDTQGDGPAVLFIHGFPLDRTMWRAPVVGLPGLLRIAPDTRGFGLSDPPPEGWSLADAADDLAALLAELRVERAVVCGLSMGGYIAFEMWRRHPARVRALVLCDTRVEVDTAEGKTQRDRTIQAVNARGTTALVEGMLEKLLAPSTMQDQPATVAQVRSMITHTPAEGAVKGLAAIRDRNDSTALLGTITVPTLVIAGSEDAIISADGQRAMAGGISGATFEVIPGAGHVPPLEQPESFTRVLGAFLKTLV